MAEGGDHSRSTKTDLPIEGGSGTKELQTDNSSSTGIAEISQRERNHGEVETENASNSPSPNYPRLSQKELKEIYGRKKYKNTTLEFEESEESEEDDGLTEVELEQTEGYKLTMRALDVMFGKPHT